MKKELLSLAALLALACTAATAQKTSSPENTALTADQRGVSSQERAKALALAGQMTLEEKLDYIGGTGFAVRALPRLHLPALEMSDGPLGVRSNTGLPSTVYAAGVGLAATWNRELAYKVGLGIGRDARARGVHFMLGPGVNIYRSPVNGRNFEYFGEDPYLAGQTAVGYIRGMQSQQVSATVKHFLTNNSEYHRHGVNSIVDERTLREIYLPAFEAAVKQAHVGAIMDSYNLINGQHATQQAHTNTEIARNEWGFDGVMMSDWVATYDAVAAANGGLDLEMPTGAWMNREKLLPAIKDGRVKLATIDEKVTRILQTAARFGWLDRPQMDASLPLYNNANHAIALQSAREAIVLLKNEGAVLPLDRAKVKSILVIGPDAYPAQPVGGGSGAAHSFEAMSILTGVGKAAGENIAVHYVRLPSFEERTRGTEFRTAAEGGKAGVTMEVFDNDELKGSPTSVRVIAHINHAGGRWEWSHVDDEDAPAINRNQVSSRRYTGYYMAKEAGVYDLGAQAAGESSGMRVYVDGKLVIDNWSRARVLQASLELKLEAGAHKVVVECNQRHSYGGTAMVAIAAQKEMVPAEARELAAHADAVVVAAGYSPESESEGADRSFRLPMGQDALIRAMSEANAKTIVAVSGGGGFDASSWIDKAPGLFELWYPGEAGGAAFGEILFGDVNPSGKLPATFERRIEDNPSMSSYYEVGDSIDAPFKEGIFVGYRGYEKNGVAPLFPFGYGLSYTSFAYANLAIKDLSTTAEVKFEASFDVTNTGSRAGAEVAELYVADGHAHVARPKKELKGFDKITLQPGETRRVTIPLDLRSLAYYDVAGKRWLAEAGDFSVLVGPSSQQIALTGKLTLKAEASER